MATVDQFLKIARGEIGTTEWPPNSNKQKYGDWYGQPGVPWCGQFVSWSAWMAGVPIPGGRFQWCDSVIERFRAAGQWHGSPLPGDLVFYNWDGGYSDHVGIVEKVLTGGRIQTIEGNTSPGQSGSQSNGGGVYRRTRTMAGVVGFGRPKFDMAAPPVAPVPPAPPVLLPLVVDGEWGPLTTRALQEALVKAGFDVGPAGIDSDLGPATIKALQRFLVARGQSVGSAGIDGDLGPSSIKALQRYLGTPVDGRLDKPKSMAVAELQRRLNAGTFR
jgi:hypothetical protein